MLGIIKIERRKKSALSLQKSPINARSFFNLNALLDAAARSGATGLIKKSRWINDLANFCPRNFFGEFGARTANAGARFAGSVASHLDWPPPVHVTGASGQAAGCG